MLVARDGKILFERGFGYANLEHRVPVTPTTKFRIGSITKQFSVTGWYQGAVMRVGKGRLAVFGEAGMFAAQVDGPKRVPFGMNTPEAKQNPQFILNVLHWLSGLLDK